MLKKLSVIAPALMFMAALALTQEVPGQLFGPNVPVNPVPGKAPTLPAGTTDVFVLTVGAWDMQPALSSTTWSHTTIGGVGYLRYSPSGGEVLAPLHLPTGVLIDHIELDACDTDASNDVGVVTLYHCQDSASGPGPCDPVDTITPPTGTPGCYYQRGTAALNYTVPDNADNDFAFDVSLPGSSTVGLRGMKVYYKLQVSTYSGTPDFTDVPASDAGYQFIEALYQSGITSGCGGGNYCPDANLTRRQMAVFLAKALGLHYPY